MPKLRNLFSGSHKKDKDHSNSSSPTSSPNKSKTPVTHPSSPVQPVAYESTQPRRAPRIGDRPLMSDGLTNPEEHNPSNPSAAVAAAPSAAGVSNGRSPDTPTHQIPRMDDSSNLDSDLARDFDRINIDNAPSHSAARSSDVLDHTRSPSQSNRYSEDVADHNIGRAVTSEYVPPPLHVAKKSASGVDRNVTSKRYSRQRETPDHEALVQDVGRRGSVSRKPVAAAVRNSDDYDIDNRGSPLGNESDDLKIVDPSRDYLVRDAARAPSLRGVVDLSNTIDTTVHESWAPAVTKTVVDQEIHHVREEVITRDIHTHEIHHRILPVIDVQVLPTRHFVPINDLGDLAEISEDQIPGRTRDKTNWIIAETVSKMTPASKAAQGSRPFTARQFAEGEGDFKEYKTKDGIPRTETTWIHPPQMEEGAMATGQTAPFHFGSQNPAEDGLTIDLPARRISGPRPSELNSNGSMDHHAELLRNGEAHGQLPSRSRRTVDPQAPPVPAHEELPYGSSRLV